MEQPVPEVSRSDVDRVIARDFDSTTAHRLAAMLGDPTLNLPPRVALAVLKLSAGDIAAVPAHLETARRDWRDVIAHAEYPNYMDATSGSAKLASDRSAEIVAADWGQYVSWLKG